MCNEVELTSAKGEVILTDRQDCYRFPNCPGSDLVGPANDSDVWDGEE